MRELADCADIFGHISVFASMRGAWPTQQDVWTTFARGSIGPPLGDEFRAIRTAHKVALGKHVGSPG